ncbi:MAG TPA: hypothetical protein PKN95_13285 [Verrucomicrobiota bacterium]|nr:hypothetical protein [Verrucomicrobiota bacterium]HNT14963.1 hypothetical protein [Verrucomicrobiota bacterium]
MIEYLGKFHPLIVHLPIGFLVLLGLFEWLALRPGGRRLRVANRLILLFTIPAALSSVLLGWFMAINPHYEARTLFWHRWLGTLAGVAVLLLWIIRQRGWFTAYRRSLFVTLILLGVAGHFGGSLTHGSGFLSWPKKRLPAAAPVSSEVLLAQPVYSTFIQPLFNDYCISCHGETKSKGGLRLDNAEQVLKGGDSGSLFAPAEGAQTLIGWHINLPEGDEDHMPPDGKPQPSSAQLAVLNWWLKSNRQTQPVTLRELEPGPEILQAIRASIAANPK